MYELKLNDTIIHELDVNSVRRLSAGVLAEEINMIPSQGFGQYVVILADGRYYHYGHLSEIRCKVGDQVKITDVIGIEGYTGHTMPAGSGGSHCHYCIRTSMSPGTALDVSAISGIPNVVGGPYDDGYRSGTSAPTTTKKSAKVTVTLDGVIYEGTLTEK